jgi:hypothetical protein
MTALNYYIKVDNQTFHKQYDFNPVKEFMCNDKSNILIELDNVSREKLEKKLEQQYEICTGFNFNDHVYIPQCACLISRYPYTDQMGKMLENLIYLYTNNKFTLDNFLKAILFITKEIPIPPNNKRLLFYIPFTNHSIEIIGPMYKELPLTNNNIMALIDLFTTENLITIQILMLLEQKILFICDNKDLLTNVIDAFICLLYPYEWVHTYIPILSEEMIKYLQSFMPFIMGIEESMLETAKEYLEESDKIYLVYIKKNFIDISSNKKNKRIAKRKELLAELPDYPLEIETDLTNKIKVLKKMIEKNKNKNTREVELNLRRMFIHAMATLIGPYSKYLSFLDDIPLFNSDSYLSQILKSNKDFCQEFIETQIFRNFLQCEAREEFSYFKNLIKNIYGEKEIRTHKRSNSTSGKRTSEIEGSSSSEGEFQQTFIIPPYYIDNPKGDLQRAIIILNDKFSTNATQYLNKAINFENIKDLKFEEMPSNCTRYIIEELKSKKQTESGFNTKIASKIKPFVLEIEKKIEDNNYELLQYRESRRQSIIFRSRRSM